jgi:hypothetical protein
MFAYTAIPHLLDKTTAMTAEGMLETRGFVGTLSCNGNEMPINFSAGVDGAGALVLKLNDVPLNSSTMFIESERNKSSTTFTYFRMFGESSDGTTFETDHLFFTGVATNLTDGRAYFVFTPRCAKGTFRIVSEKSGPVGPRLGFWLRGTRDLHWIGQLSATSPQGTIRMNVTEETDVPNEVTHHLSIAAADGMDSDVQGWRSEADRLLAHVQKFMSFAAGIHMTVPIEEFFQGAATEVTVHSPIEQRGTELPTFRWREGGEFLKVVTEAFPRGEALWPAVAWFLLPAVYNEQRLVNAMTALESLVDSGLSDEEKVLLGPRKKKEFAGAVKKLIGQSFVGESFKILRCQLYEKVGEFERRSFKRKLDALLAKLAVPTEDLEGRIFAAIDARNLVVHQGVYGEAEDEEEGNMDLWGHMTVIRELITRIVFRTVGYGGAYLTHVGGSHDAVFPPTASERYGTALK